MNFTADARVLRALFKNAAAFASDDKSRPILGGALVEVFDTGDGAAKIRTVSTDSYGLLIQTLEVNAENPAHGYSTTPVLVDPRELVKLIPGRKGKTTLTLTADGVNVQHATEGQRAGQITVPGDFPDWRSLFAGGVTEEPLEPGLVFGHKNLTRFRDVVDPHGNEPSWAIHLRAGTTAQQTRPTLFVAASSGVTRWHAIALLMPVRQESPPTAAQVELDALIGGAA